MKQTLLAEMAHGVSSDRVVAPWGGEWGGKRSGCCSEKEKENFFKE